MSESQDGLESIFIRNRDKFARFLQKNGTGSHTEDLLQDMWLRLSPDPVRRLDDPVLYLYRMAYNMMLDHRRGRMRSGWRERQWSEINGPSVEGVSDEPSVERLLIAKEAWTSAEAHLHRIGEPASQIFRLHRIEGKTQRAIAAELRMGLSTVEKHLRKACLAMNSLKESLHEV
jgi:RNA polymerase sigma factor (sigma-70 family)